MDTTKKYTTQRFQKYPKPVAEPGEVFVGFLSESEYKLSLWKFKRHGLESRPGPNEDSLPVYPVFVDAVEYVKKFHAVPRATV